MTLAGAVPVAATPSRAGRRMDITAKPKPATMNTTWATLALQARVSLATLMAQIARMAETAVNTCRGMAHATGGQAVPWNTRAPLRVLMQAAAAPDANRQRAGQSPPAKSSRNLRLWPREPCIPPPKS